MTGWVLGGADHFSFTASSVRETMVIAEGPWSEWYCGTVPTSSTLAIPALAVPIRAGGGSLLSELTNVSWGLEEGSPEWGGVVVVLVVVGGGAARR